MYDIKNYIAEGKAVLGIEFGSTRIKAVLVGAENEPIASGSFEWENSLVDGIWTYSMEEVSDGIKACYADMVKDVNEKYGCGITKLASIGISAMMHGYLAFDKNDNLLVPFRTWRNTMTGEAAAKLSAQFKFNVPQRWSISHFYQAILNKESHVKDVAFLTTLAGYVHFLLTGERVLGIGDASGMFPIDCVTKQYISRMADSFNALPEVKEFGFDILKLLPTPLMAGAPAGTLTTEGAKYLDASGALEAGAPVCPPEGDAGTGMAATNSIRVRTGNVSAGTSVFSMVVLEKEMKNYYPEIDVVTTPVGDNVAMVHCNNCTSDLNAWVGLFREFAGAIGAKVSNDELYGTLYNKALEADPSCDGLLAYNYFSGEHVTGFDAGRPVFARTPDAKFDLASFMRTNLYASLGALKSGLDILLSNEEVPIDRMYGHGGLFKTKGVGQKILAAAINAPVSVMQTAGEGGAWGIALLASYLVNKKDGQELADFLTNDVFKGEEGSVVEPDAKDVEGFTNYMARYKKGLEIERAAVNSL